MRLRSQEPISTQLLRSYLQDYLEDLWSSRESPPELQRRSLLASYAELKYRLCGGGKCGVCRAPVRHVVPVKCEREDGTVSSYACLCTRCFEAEKKLSRKVAVGIGRAVEEITAKR